MELVEFGCTLQEGRHRQLCTAPMDTDRNDRRIANFLFAFRFGVTSGRVSFIPRWKRHKAILMPLRSTLALIEETLATRGLGASFERRRLTAVTGDWRTGNEELCQSYLDRKIERQQDVPIPMAMYVI